MEEYSVENIILEEPEFTSWTKHVLNKRDRIISKAQQYWVKNHKYGLRVPKTVNNMSRLMKRMSILSGGTLSCRK